MTKQEKLAAMISDLASVARKHGVVLDKYVDADGETKYFFKLQFDDIEVELEKVFLPVYHGPPEKNPNFKAHSN